MPIMPDRPAVYLPLKIRSAYNLLKVKKEYISLCISETNLGISSQQGLLGTPYVIQNFQTQKKDCFYLLISASFSLPRMLFYSLLCSQTSSFLKEIKTHLLSTANNTDGYLICFGYIYRFIRTCTN